ncbi:MAG: UDP-N-acetylglucosamine 2-epimerase (hydrolyzing) [Candidatus Portnoybacteria bacterium]|nr:UDP-N-acetylglucosamine 2-epimerase (hydrolyzing) [Candidatus Portnoybacteria bacterium]
MMRKILYISGTRADYGLMRHTLYAIRRHPTLVIEVAAAGMHLMPEFGLTINEVKNDKFIVHEIHATYERDDKESMARFLATCIINLTGIIKDEKPDILLVLGDRAEMLAGAIAGAYLGIPVFHIHGGDKSSDMDEIARHAITKLSHIHLAATKTSAKRIIYMGEDAWRVFVVGAPGLDSILQEKLFTAAEIINKYHIEKTRPIIIVVQHPVTQEAHEASKQIKETLEAVRELGYQTILIYPNADAGGRSMIQVIERYRRYPFIHIYKNVSHKEYLSLMNIANVMVGNSSSGIIEAPSFHLPFVNIGTRQKGRERGVNVIDAGCEKNEIKQAVQKALFDTRFIKKIKTAKNPYGEGRTAQKITKLLSEIPIDARLLRKQITY